MYQALYRKWRPKAFADVIGQEHITETLRRQVAEGRTSHAYLFTGTRGTGKTTCAKILAKAVNCEAPVDGDPCGKCPSCVGIDSGGFLDVLELDAASNNGVDQVRALRDEAVYSPANVKKRVYIVDEVHMLSTAAFNALLKILEEPPEHLMFILATTELHKVPATILSRCQRFSFRRIRPEDAARRLSYVAEQESIDLRPDGAELLSRLADGALRDGLSLLDQCAAAGGTIDAAAVLDVLGLAGNLQTARLMELILSRDAQEALLLLDELYKGGKDMGAVLSELSDPRLIARTIVETGGGSSRSARPCSPAATTPPPWTAWERACPPGASCTWLPPCKRPRRSCTPAPTAAWTRSCAFCACATKAFPGTLRLWKPGSPGWRTIKPPGRRWPSGPGPRRRSRPRRLIRNRPPRPNFRTRLPGTSLPCRKNRP